MVKRRVVVIGGFDPSGRAGILADVETVRALGASAAAVITTITAQGGRKFRAQPLAPALIAAQLDAAAAAGPVHAIKLGVIPSRPVLAVILRFLRAHGVPTVVDPVVRTSRGERLSSLTGADFARLGGPKVVLTPNVAEAPAVRGRFAGLVIKSIAPGCDAVLRPGKKPKLLTGDPLPRNRTHHRGTGCRFASAMAVDLAMGHTVVHAAGAAKAQVRKFLLTPILRQVW